MTNVWPIENIWSIIMNDLIKYELKNTEQLQYRKKITEIWRNINNDRELMKNLMSSIPKRFQAVIKKDGAQIFNGIYLGPTVNTL